MGDIGACIISGFTPKIDEGNVQIVYGKDIQQGMAEDETLRDIH